MYTKNTAREERASVVFLLFTLRAFFGVFQKIFPQNSVGMDEPIVKDIMTSEVLSVTPDTPLQEVARILTENRIHGVPVVSEGVLAGVITETDFFTKDSSKIYLPSYIQFLKKTGISKGIRGTNRKAVDRLLEARARDIMSAPCKTVRESLSVRALIRLFKESELTFFPVTNDSGSLSGVVTVVDVFRSFDV
ncbi:MAG: CBS domain-containing protein [Candidatus Moraniibacteriota bacterium]|nr:MAG: CBS domain-containing protein [Candidatus Moranbacteria bacterium]